MKKFFKLCGIKSLIIISVLALNADRNAYSGNICKAADSWDMSVIPDLIDSLAHDSSDNRLCAIEGLSKFGDHTAIPILIKSMTDKNETIKLKAGNILNRMMREYNNSTNIELRRRKLVTDTIKNLDREHINILKKSALDYNGEIRITSLNILAIIKDLDTADIILENAKLEDYYFISNAAREAFFSFGKKAAPFFAKVLERDSSENDVLTACWFLYYCGDKTVAPAVMKHVKKSKNLIKDDHLLEALASCSAEDAIPIFQGLLKSKNINVRKTALSALKKSAPGYGKKLIPIISNIMLYDKDWDIDRNIRWDAADVLGIIGSDAAMPYLHKAIFHKDRFVRSGAVRSLKIINNEESIPFLIKAYKMESSSYVSSIIVETLQKMPGSIKHIIQLLKSGNPKIQDYGITILNSQQKFPDSANRIKMFSGPVAETTPYLIDILKTRKKKWYIIKALGKCGDNSAWPPLHKLWKSGDDNMTYLLIETYGDLQNPKAVPLLIQVLTQHKRESFREDAAVSLGKIGSPNALPALHKALFTETYDRAQTKIAAAIKKITHKESLPVLLNAISDKRVNSNAKSEACGAIFQLCDKSVSPDILIEKLSTIEPSYRGKIALALGKIGNKDAVPPLKKIIKKYKQKGWDTEEYERALRMLIR